MTYDCLLEREAWLGGGGGGGHTIGGGGGLRRGDAVPCMTSGTWSLRVPYDGPRYALQEILVKGGRGKEPWGS